MGTLSIMPCGGVSIVTDFRNNRRDNMVTVVVAGKVVKLADLSANTLADNIKNMVANSPNTPVVNRELEAFELALRRAM